ncbi:hypothetical protein Acr_16g0001730 [Actinidia rufa]|uniref:Uncharacterized protein n=1 Tax=Actinidia rufa TaxID=165716 RepID=A0A7J0FXY5_9ERIC|nr:hypothetical protein Acr_16g0001730 [Actinidia rufa]
MALVKPRVWLGLCFLRFGLFLIHELFQVLIPKELVKKGLKEGTLPLLIAPFGVHSQGGFGLLEVWLILNSRKELVDRFFENYINPLPCLVLVINWSSFHLLSYPLPRGAEPAFHSTCRTSSSSWGEHFNLRHEDDVFTQYCGSSAVKLVALINSSVALGVKNLAEIRTRRSLARRYSPLAQRDKVTIILVVQDDAGSALWVYLFRWGKLHQLVVNQDLCHFSQLGLQALDGYVPAVSSSKEQPTWILPRGGPGRPLGIIQ